MIIIVIVFLIIVLAGNIGFFAVGVKEAQRKTIFQRLYAYSDRKENKNNSIKTALEDEMQQSFFKRVINPIINGMALKFNKNSKKSQQTASLAKQLMLAGNPSNIGPGEFMAIQILAAVGLSFFLMFIPLILKLKAVFSIIFFAVGMGFGYMYPRFWLGGKVKKRKKEVQKNIPDTLDLLTVSVEAGLGFDMAMAKVAEKAKHALAEEFRKALQEIKMGRTRKDALKDIYRRTEVDDIDSFTNAIIQAEQLGVSIGNVLRIQSDQIRVLRMQKIEEKAMRAPLLMMIPMVLFIFPTIFIVVLGPIALKVYRSFTGGGF